MRRTLFSGLIILTLIAVAVAFTLPRQTGTNDAAPSGLLLPELQEQVNSIDWLQLSSGGEVVATARRSEDSWVIDEAGGYQADWSRIQGLLSGLAAARIVEPKTAKPEYHDRLGVEDPAQPGAAGVLVAFQPSTGLPGVIVGNTPQGRDGQYLRLADSEQAVLVDREIDVPKNSEAWIRTEVIDIAEDEVVEIAITHPGENVVVARKVSADDENFVLQGVPEGRQAKSEWAVDSLAGGLSSLKAEAVKPAGEFDWADAVRYRVVTSDGLLVEARAVTQSEEGSDDTSFWVELEAGVYTTALEAATDEDNAAMTTGRADEINRRTRGWAFRVPKYKYDTMTTGMDELLAPPGDSG